MNRIILMKGRKPYTQEQVIEKFKKIHGDKYIYDQVEYQRMNKAVTVTCPTWKFPYYSFKTLYWSRLS